MYVKNKVILFSLSRLLLSGCKINKKTQNMYIKHDKKLLNIYLHVIF